MYIRVWISSFDTFQVCPKCSFKMYFIMSYIGKCWLYVLMLGLTGILSYRISQQSRPPIVESTSILLLDITIFYAAHETTIGNAAKLIQHDCVHLYLNGSKLLPQKQKLN